MHRKEVEITVNASPQHFMVNNKETGLEDVYAKPISPKQVTSKIPPPPPPRANPPKQKTLKFQTSEDSSNSIYDNPISYKSNDKHVDNHSSAHLLIKPRDFDEVQGINRNQNGSLIQNSDKNVTTGSNEKNKDKGKNGFVYKNILRAYFL